MEMKLKLQNLKISYLLVVIITCLVLSGCQSSTGQQQGGNSDKRLKVVATIAQIAEPLSVIGGEYIEVIGLIGTGVDPHLYQVTTGDIKKLDESDMIVYSGLHLEANMLTAFQQMEASKPVIAIGETVPEEQLLKDKTTGAIDPHIWFDIPIWKSALHAAVEEIIKLVPEHEDQLRDNMEQYFTQLDELHADNKEKLAEIGDEQRILVTAHDAFGYFGRAYDIQVIGLQGLSTEDEIGLSDIENTINLLIEHAVPAVFIESSINPASIQAVIEGAKKNGLEVVLGGELYSDAMGAEGTVEGTYLGMYAHNVTTIMNGLLGRGE